MANTKNPCWKATCVQTKNLSLQKLFTSGSSHLDFPCSSPIFFHSLSKVMKQLHFYQLLFPPQRQTGERSNFYVQCHRQSPAVAPDGGAPLKCDLRTTTQAVFWHLYIAVTSQTISKCRYYFQAKVLGFFFLSQSFPLCLIKEQPWVSHVPFAGGGYRALQAEPAREQNVLSSSSKEMWVFF